MDACLNGIVRYLVAQSWQIAVLTAIVAAATFALRHRSAHVRYLLWLVVLTKCLVPPFYIVPLHILPSPVPGGIPDLLLPSDWFAGHSGSPSSASPEESSVQIHESTPSARSLQADGGRLSASGWLGIIWIVGAGAYVAMNLLRAVRGHYWLRRTRRLLPTHVHADVTGSLRACGIRRQPRIWMVEGVGQPFVWGLLRGSIYVPPGFLAIESHEHRRDVLAHELSHILRFDAAVNFLQVIAQAIFWFHPFVWWANRRIRVEREKCCDEAAIARLHTRAKDYCSAVVETLANVKKSTRPVPSLAVAGPITNIEERIRTMLRPGKRFYRRPSLLAAIVVLLAALLVVPTALALTAGAEPKAAPEPEKKPVKSLHQAAADGDMEQVKWLIEKGANVNTRDTTGQTPLHKAAIAGHRNVAELLLAKGADINAKSNTWDTTPLIAAIRSGHEDIASLLIARGGDVRATGRGDYTALHCAAMNRARMTGPTEIMELLLARGADIEARQEHGATPLACATYDGNAESTNYLLKHGANIEAKLNDDETTPLLRAVNEEYLETAKLLLDRGANVHATWRGLSAVQVAMMGDQLSNRKSDPEMVKLLVEKGLDCPAIHIAAHSGDLEKVKRLIADGTRIDEADRAAYTPLHCAVCGDHRDVVRFLLDKGADVNAKTVNGWTPVAFAWTADMAAFLIANGADVRIASRFGTTVLHRAVNQNEHKGDKVLIELLLKHGANIDAKAGSTCTGWEGWTPLHVACRNGAQDIVELLLARGADVNAKTDKGETPVAIAQNNGHGQIVDLLRRHGAKE